MATVQGKELTMLLIIDLIIAHVTITNSRNCGPEAWTKYYDNDIESRTINSCRVIYLNDSFTLDNVDRDVVLQVIEYCVHTPYLWYSWKNLDLNLNIIMFIFLFNLETRKANLIHDVQFLKK